MLGLTASEVLSSKGIASDKRDRRLNIGGDLVVSGLIGGLRVECGVGLGAMDTIVARLVRVEEPLAVEGARPRSRRCSQNGFTIHFSDCLDAF